MTPRALVSAHADLAGPPAMNNDEFAYFSVRWKTRNLVYSTARSPISSQIYSTTKQASLYTYSIDVFQFANYFRLLSRLRKDSNYFVSVTTYYYSLLRHKAATLKIYKQ